jgi:hypoxanthine phosphoribosyltransferase
MVNGYFESKQYTYEDFYKDINQLAMSIDKNYDVIVGLTRGGLVPAVALAHKLGIDRLIPIEWGRKYTQDLKSVRQALYHSKKVLIVDDILDDGTTIKTLLDALKQPMSEYEKQNLTFDVAVLLANTDSPHFNLVNYSAQYIDRKTFKEWVDFFWEV